MSHFTSLSVTKPYVNIHTHHLPQEDGVFLFNNRFGFDLNLFTGKFFSAGIHPWDAGLDISINALENLVTRHNCLAVGECGLDALKGPDLHTQKSVFVRQLQLAVNHSKPVIIHCVKAFGDLIEVCGPYIDKIPLIIHGFNKSEQLAVQLIHKGFYLSLSAALFSKNGFNFKALPMEAVFFETDTNDGILINGVYQKAAIAFNKSDDELKEKIYANFTTLFKPYGR